jgi:hypothetical protein
MKNETHKLLNNIVGTLVLTAASVFIAFFVIMPTYLKLKQQPKIVVVDTANKVVLTEKEEYPTLPAPPDEKKEFADAMFGRYNNEVGESNAILCIMQPKIGDTLTTSFDSYVYESKVIPYGYAVKVVKVWVKQSNKQIFAPKKVNDNLVVYSENIKLEISPIYDEDYYLTHIEDTF